MKNIWSDLFFHWLLWIPILLLHTHLIKMLYDKSVLSTTFNLIYPYVSQNHTQFQADYQVVTLLQVAHVLRSTSTLTPPLHLFFFLQFLQSWHLCGSVQEHCKWTPVWQVWICVLALSTLGTTPQYSPASSIPFLTLFYKTNWIGIPT